MFFSIKSREWCPLCRQKCQELVEGSEGSWKLFVTKKTHKESGKQKKGRTTYPKCVGTGRAPNRVEMKKENDRRQNEKRKCSSKIKKNKKVAAPSRKNNKKQKVLEI